MKYAEKMIAFGLNVAYYRKKQLMTQEQLAEKIHLSIGTIRRIENPNIYAGTTLETICRLADALHVTESALLDFREQKD